MGRFKIKRLLRIMCLMPVVLVVNLLITLLVLYCVLVADIYINTDRLSEVSYPLELYCGNVARYYQFTKGPVVFRVDRGTLVYRLNPYVTAGDLYAYAPFFIFPHHRTVIISEKVLYNEYLDVLVAHELGHIQGGLEFWGKVRDMEKYANNFAIEVVGKKRFDDFELHLIGQPPQKESSKKEPSRLRGSF